MKTNPPVTDSPARVAPPVDIPPFLSRFEIIVSALFGLLALILLLTPPALGLANNGDFLRITTNVGLKQIHNESVTLTRYVEPFSITRIPHPDHLNIISRIAVLTPVRLAKVLNSLTSHQTFDLRWLSFVYVLMSMIAMALWVRATRRRPLWVRIVLAAAYAFIFLDLGYLVYFGSLYTETPTLIYLLCAIGCLLNLWEPCGTKWCRQSIWVVGFFVFCTLFAASKAQNAPLVFPLLLVGTLAIFWTRSRLLFSLAIVLAIASLGLSIHSVRDYDVSLRSQNAINTVFNGLLVDSPDRAGDLKKLGLRPEWAAWADRSQFTPDSPFKDPTFKEEYFKKITPGKIAIFYAEHPNRLIAPLRKAAESLFNARLTYGNFTQASGISAKALWDVHSAGDLPAAARWKWPLLQAFGSWSRLQGAIVPGKLWFWLTVAIAVGGIGLIRAMKCKTARARIVGAALISLAVMLLMVPPICVAGDGTWEINKHVFLGGVVFDLMLLLILDAVLSRISKPTFDAKPS